jgi:hypothetical protein
MYLLRIPLFSEESKRVSEESNPFDPIGIQAVYLFGVQYKGTLQSSFQWILLEANPIDVSGSSPVYLSVVESDETLLQSHGCLRTPTF